MSLIFSESTSLNAVAIFRMLPNNATDIPATMIVVGVAPSHTIKRGARADFGRLFNTTRKGSVISDNFLLNHNRVAHTRLNKVTKIKLIMVSYNVTPI